ncbi:hypothetical protein FIBSPDRAFT_868566 [Athelia psychrophila]|uniref:Uncharacterized protein n=1 Tax=Athelia psychrophila TaxID=1759441 RepID=A0A166D0F2_9AGAM|nr:hypothetical protein FIBSPDRAFT_868566 [Fibularhizoctonia sp. CBS 109695]
MPLAASVAREEAGHGGSVGWSERGPLTGSGWGDASSAEIAPIAFAIKVPNDWPIPAWHERGDEGRHQRGLWKMARAVEDGERMLMDDTCTHARK